MTVVSAPMTAADLAGLVEEIWASFVRLDPPLQRAAAPPPTWVGEPWSGMVSLGGPTDGPSDGPSDGNSWCQVRVDLDHRLAFVLTSQMLGPTGLAETPGGPTADDLADAVGQLTNVVGGNVNGRTGGGRLSLPTVGQPLAHAPGHTVACRSDHLRDGYRLAVTILTPAAGHDAPSLLSSPEAR
jgi:hypothetical protein